MSATETLDDIRINIENEVEFVDVKPYSHNIISLNLRIAAEKFGDGAANELIDEFGLESLGWSKVKNK